MCLPEEPLLEEVGTDVASIQVSDLTARPDLLQAPNACPWDVRVFLGLDHNDEAWIHGD